MARPTKLTVEMNDAALDYIRNHEKYGYILPTVSGLADHLKISKRTIHYWRKRSEEFFRTYDMLMGKQEQILINKGLSGEMDTAICKLLLANNHGYRTIKEKGVFAPFRANTMKRGISVQKK